jgi:hypothetical protein
MNFQHLSDNLCSRREVSCFVTCQRWMSVSHKHVHVIVMISFIWKPEEGKEEARWMTSYLHPWAHQILKHHMVAHPWGLQYNSLQSNAKCVIYSGSPLLVYIIPYTGISKWCLDWPRSRYSDEDSSCNSLSPPLVVTFTRRGKSRAVLAGYWLSSRLSKRSLNNLPTGYWFVL